MFVRAMLTDPMPRAGGVVTAPGRRERAKDHFYGRRTLLPGHGQDFRFSSMIDSHASGGEGSCGDGAPRLYWGSVRRKADVDTGL